MKKTHIRIIKQIMPINQEIYSVFEFEGEFTFSKVLALALYEKTNDDLTYTAISPVSFAYDMLDIDEEVSNFVGMADNIEEFKASHTPKTQKVA